MKNDKKKLGKFRFMGIILAVVSCLFSYFVYFSEASAQAQQAGAVSSCKKEGNNLKAAEEKLKLATWRYDWRLGLQRSFTLKGANKAENQRQFIKGLQQDRQELEGYLKHPGSLEPARIRAALKQNARDLEEAKKSLIIYEKDLESLKKELEEEKRKAIGPSGYLSEAKKNFEAAKKALGDCRKRAEKRQQGKQPQRERRVSSISEIAGTYNCSGTNPDGSTYQGKVTLVSSGGNSFKAHWVIQGEEWYGSGSITKDGKLHIRYTGAFSGDGTWALAKDGSFKGVWRGSGGRGQGRETWTGYIKSGEAAKKIAKSSLNKEGKKAKPEELEQQRRQIKKELKKINADIEQGNWLRDNYFTPEMNTLIKKQQDKRAKLLRQMRAENERLSKNPQADTSSDDEEIEKLKEEIKFLDSDQKYLNKLEKDAAIRLKSLKQKRAKLQNQLKNIVK